MKLTKRKGFNFFRSYYDVYNELETIEDKVAFMDALLDRQFLGIKPTELKGMVKFAYISQTNSIDSQVKGYEDKTGEILNSTPTQPPADGGVIPPTEQVEEEVEVKGKVEVKEKKEVKAQNKDIDIQAFLDWFNIMKEKYTGVKGKFLTINKTTLNNLKQLKQLKLTPQDWEHAFQMMCANDWVKEKQMCTPTHLLVNDNFLRYLNQEKSEAPKQQKSIEQLQYEHVMKQMELYK
jgi:hypothetical protein